MVKDAQKLYKQYKLEFWLLVGAVVLWKFSKFFGAAADLITQPLATVVERSQAAAEDAHDKQIVKAVNPKATSADVAVFREDARAIAAALGYLPGKMSNFFVADRTSAFQVLKKYTRWIMVSGKPKLVNGKRQERLKSLQLPVLYPFYKEVTDGRVLRTDLDKYFTFDNSFSLIKDEMSPYYQQYIRV